MKARRIILHESFTSGVNGVVELLAKAKAGFVGRVCAPTGAGKSEITAEAARTVFGRTELWASGQVPIAFVRATRSLGGRFSPKHFAGRAYQAVMNPDLRWLAGGYAGASKERESRQQAYEHSELYKAFMRGNGEESLRELLVDVIHSRGVRVLVVEDAHSMTATTKHVRPADYLQPWVSLAEQTGVILLFVGTTALLDLWDGENEAHRRSRTVYIRRYHLETDASAVAFGKVLRQLAEHYEWERGYRPLGDLQFVYVLTMGLFGQMQALFDRASLRAAEDGRQCINRADMRAAAGGAKEQRKIAQSVAEFDLLSRPVEFDELMKIHKECFPRSRLSREASRDAAAEEAT